MVGKRYLFRREDMRTRILSIISIGITLGFLLGMGFVAIMRSAINGGTSELEVAFTMMGALMGGALIYYVVKSVR